MEEEACLARLIPPLQNRSSTYGTIPKYILTYNSSRAVPHESRRLKIQ
jgi:hypothetical protein